MRPRTICDPEALNDWRANDEAAPAYRWQPIDTHNGEIHHETRNHAVPKEQKKPLYVLPRHIEETILGEIRRCRALREEGEA
jgi:hypothetical protein